jgi:DNA-binding LytR/AlgR family response regulator
MCKKILLIEDEPDLIDNLKTLLESHHYSVLTANNGLEGINCIKECSPDLIICDIMMPEMDGYEVIKELNKNPKLSLIPFIFLTAKVDRKDLRKGMEFGADDYLFKPFGAKELLSAIQTRLTKFESLRANLKSTHQNKKLNNNDNIILNINNSPCIIKLDRIKYITAERQYSRIVLKDDKKIVLRKSLNEWENMLNSKIFIRIHRKTIINIEYIEKIEKNIDSSTKIILLGDRNKFDISRRYLKKIKTHFSF